MKQGHVRKFTYLVLCILFAIITAILPSVNARADTGPKASVTITVEGLEGQNWEMTLLADSEGWGPYDAENINDYKGAVGFDAFSAYAQTDDFYFWGYTEDSYEEDGIFCWDYYPPDTFKIAIYLPDSNSLLVYDQVVDKYAFDSNYQLKISNLTVNEDGISQADMTLKEIPVTGDDIFSFCCRVVCTLLIEVGIAFWLFYRKKAQILTILFTNILTQVLLNLAVNLIRFKNGSLRAIISYLWLELLVFVIEACIYSFCGKMHEGETNLRKAHWKAVLYAFIANLASFLVGGYLFLLWDI